MGEHGNGVASDEQLSWLSLALVPGVGPVVFGNLLAQFQSAEAVLAASQDELCHVPGVGRKLARGIAASRDHVQAQQELSACTEQGLQLHFPGGAHYPRPLSHQADGPLVLFERGQRTRADELAIAIVGTRHASFYGRQQAGRLSRALARAGVTIVSGLARGIDTVAHEAALEAGGRTVAVLGTGLCNVYPAENQTLAARIAQQGAVLSEYPCSAPPRRGSFPRRNRIIAGLSLGVVVVEAGERSGALITARLAGEQGKEVFAVPGPVDSRLSRGCHRLIRDGAKLVEDVTDVLAELGPLSDPTCTSQGEPIRHGAELSLNDMEKRVLASLGDGPTAIDLVAERANLPIHRVLAVISALEMRSLLRRLSGTVVVRSPH